MSGNEFAHWVAYYILEARDQERAQKRARNRASARRTSLAASGGGG